VLLSLHGDQVAEKVIPRPSGTATDTSTTFTNLPVNTLDVSVAAYPTTDATGTAQAVGSGTLQVSPTTTNNATVSLSSTVSKLSFSPSTLSLYRNESSSLTLAATDSSGDIVLLSVGGESEPVTWATSDPTVVTITGTTATATVKGIATGNATVTATLKVDDSGKTVSASLPIAVSIQALGQYAVQDLGTLGGPTTAPIALNDAGTVVGQSDLPAGAPDGTHGFLWKNGVLTDLGRFGSTLANRKLPSRATGVNSAGTVVGTVWNQDPTPEETDAYIYQNGTSTPLTSSIPGAYAVLPSCLNGSGLIVGTVDVWLQSGAGVAHPVVWQNGTETDLFTAGVVGIRGACVCCTSQGHVLASADGTYIWKQGSTATRISVDASFVPTWMNVSDSVVGSGRVTSGEFHALKWANGQTTDLGTLGGTTSAASSINDLGVVVGTSAIADGTGHAFVWQNGKMKDLNSLVNLSGWVLASAAAVNKDGQIVCYGIQGSSGHAFLLTPR